MAKIQTLTDDECSKIMIELDTRICKGQKKKAHIRNRLVVLLMLDAGFRLSEVAKTKRGALMFAGHFTDTVTVTIDAAKLHVERQIPTTNRLKETLRMMHQYVWEPDTCSLSDIAIYKDFKFTALSVRQLQRIVGQISNSAIGRNINPHMLRHTFATRLMGNVSMRVVQELLGHKSITSTQIYTHPNGQDLKSAIATLD